MSYSIDDFTCPRFVKVSKKCIIKTCQCQKLWNSCFIESNYKMNGNLVLFPTTILQDGDLLGLTPIKNSLPTDIPSDIKTQQLFVWNCSAESCRLGIWFCHNNLAVYVVLWFCSNKKNILKPIFLYLFSKKF